MNIRMLLEERIAAHRRTMARLDANTQQLCESLDGCASGIERDHTLAMLRDIFDESVVLSRLVEELELIAHAGASEDVKLVA